jgi:hypothetical protein
MDGFRKVESSQTPARGPQFGPSEQKIANLRYRTLEVTEFHRFFTIFSWMESGFFSELRCKKKLLTFCFIRLRFYTPVETTHPPKY